MAYSTLYEQLGVSVRSNDRDRGETQRKGNIETVDNDQAIQDLYAMLGGPVDTPGSAAGETDATRQAPETVDKDRGDQLISSSLLAPPVDLYMALADTAPADAAHGSETLRTLADSETIDNDRALDFRYG
jgi:hypothetical protein